MSKMDHRAFFRMNSCLEIVRKKLVNFPTDGFVCRRCGRWFSWRPDKKAMVARQKRFRKTPINKIREMRRRCEPPIYCDECFCKLNTKEVPKCSGE